MAEPKTLHTPRPLAIERHTLRLARECWGQARTYENAVEVQRAARALNAAAETRRQNIKVVK